MAKRQHTEAEIQAEGARIRERLASVDLAPQADTQPVQPSTPPPSMRQDENQGLALRLLELRNLVEEQRQAWVRDFGEMKKSFAQLTEQVNAMGTRIDRECEAIHRNQKDLEVHLREGGDQVRQAGQLARQMTDKMAALEELRAVATDPHEVVKPLQRNLALLKGDLLALQKAIDVRFEQLPKPRMQPWEARGDDESPIDKLSKLCGDLHRRVKALEG